MKIVGVNGILVSKKSNASTDHLLQIMGDRGYTIQDFNYPFTTAVMAYSKRRRCEFAKRLKDMTTEDDVVFGHSFGCAVIWQAVQMGAKFKAIMLLGAAIEEDHDWPIDCARTIFNVHNPKDSVLTLGSILPGHIFGKLGKVGYKGEPNPLIININADKWHRKKTWFGTHSDYFHEDNIQIWANMLDSLCQSSPDTTGGIMKRITQFWRKK